MVPSVLGIPLQFSTVPLSRRDPEKWRTLTGDDTAGEGLQFSF